MHFLRHQLVLICHVFDHAFDKKLQMHYFPRRIHNLAIVVNLFNRAEVRGMRKKPELFISSPVLISSLS